MTRWLTRELHFHIVFESASQCFEKNGPIAHEQTQDLRQLHIIVPRTHDSKVLALAGMQDVSILPASPLLLFYLWLDIKEMQ